MLATSTYHKVLRVAAVVCALVLTFDSGVIADSTAHISDNTQAYLANAVGVGARIEATELNQVTAELTARKTALDVREAAITERELSLGLTSAEAREAGEKHSTYVLAGILFILLVLIVLNYVLDFIHAYKRPRQAA